MSKSPIVGPQGQTIYRERPKRVFDCIAPIDVFPEGEWSDWPSNVQDGIYKALEQAELAHKVKLKIVKCIAETDPDGHYIRIVAIEQTQH